MQGHQLLLSQQCALLAQVLANERTAGDLGAAGDPGQWISNWTSLLSVVSADPAAAPRVHVDLLDSPDAYGLRCAPLPCCMPSRGLPRRSQIMLAIRVQVDQTC